LKLKTRIDFEGYVAGVQINWHVIPMSVDSPNEGEDPFLWARFIDDETGKEVLDISVEELTKIVRALDIAIKAEEQGQNIDTS